MAVGYKALTEKCISAAVNVSRINQSDVKMFVGITITSEQTPNDRL